MQGAVQTLDFWIQQSRTQTAKWARTVVPSLLSWNSCNHATSMQENKLTNVHMFTECIHYPWLSVREKQVPEKSSLWSLVYKVRPSAPTKKQEWYLAKLIQSWKQRNSRWRATSIPGRRIAIWSIIQVGLEIQKGLTITLKSNKERAGRGKRTLTR